MKTHLFFSIIVLFLFFNSSAQVSFSTMEAPYSQDFSSISITGSDGGSQTWTDNSSLTGWYISPSTVRLELSPTSSLQNTGGPYIIKNGTDISIGSRASGTSPNNNIYLGLRFKNNTGLTIKSLKVEYYGEQYSIAENNGNVNNLAFHYQKSASAITSLTSGSWTALSALNFTQLYTSTDSPSKGGTACSGTSNQCVGLDGNSTPNRTYKSLNFDVTLNPGDEIMLRWYDADNTSNDHHLQIDDVIVTPYEQVSSVVLPIDLIDFSGTCFENEQHFFWATASELNNDFFSLESSLDAKNFKEVSQIKAIGTSSSETKYEHSIENLENEIYFRLKQTDINGSIHILKTIYLPCSTQDEFKIYPNPSSSELNLSSEKRNTEFFITNALGQIVLENTLFDFQFKMDVTHFQSGIYFLNLQTENGLKNYKFTVKN